MALTYFPETPAHATPGHSTPGGGGWAETPKTDRGGDLIQDTPTAGASKRRSRWDETPGQATPGGLTPSAMTPSAMTPSMTPGSMTPSGMTPGGLTPGGSTPSGMTPSGVTPTGQKAMAMATPTPGHLMSMTPEQLQAFTWQREIDERNRPLSDEELDSLFPTGYKVWLHDFWGSHCPVKNSLKGWGYFVEIYLCYLFDANFVCVSCSSWW